MGHIESGHPGKGELRHQLLLVAKHLGLDTRDIDDLVDSARIIEVRDEKQICSSREQDGMVNFIIKGVAAVCLHRCDGPPRPPRPAILKLIGPGEFFCLAPPPKDESYFVKAVTYPRADKRSNALVALWARAALRDLVRGMDPDGTFQLLETSWRLITRVGEEQAILMQMTLPERLEYVLARLARRFKESHKLGTLIDLWLPDERLGELVSGARGAVNKALAKRPRFVRVGPGTIVMRPPQMVTA